MPNTDNASATATTNPLSAEIQTRFFRATRTKNNVRTGSADTAVDNTRLPNGSYSCDQDMTALAYGRGRYVLLKPLRVLVTVNVPSCWAVTLIRYAGICPAAPAPAPPGPRPGPAPGAPARGAGGAPGVGGAVVSTVA